MMYLHTEKINDLEKIMTIDPPRLLIENDSQDLFFEISFYTNIIP